MTLFSLEIPKIISALTSFFTLLAAIFNLVLYLLLLHSKFVKAMMKKLLISPKNLIEFGLNKQKITLIGSYIWDYSLCCKSSETIRGFIILLLVKSISKSFFDRIKSGLIKIVSGYLLEFTKEKRNKLKFAMYILKNLDK